MKTNEVRAGVTEKLIKLMSESKDRPWRQPWSLGPNVGLPTAASTGKPYRGGNAIALDITAMIDGYKSKNWNTFQNWRQFGIFPRSGSKGTWGLFFGSRTIESDDEKKPKGQPIMRSFVVFNAEQCHGDKLTAFLVQPPDPNSPALAVSYEAFDAMIQRLQVDVNHDALSACNHPDTNKIDMPARGYFESYEVYYSVFAHELTHWADRKNGNTGRHAFGSEDYAFGELVAEIGSAYLLRELGMPAVSTEQTDYNAAVYLSSWLKALKNDDSYIFKAASRASQLVDFMTGNKAPAEKENE